MYKHYQAPEVVFTDRKLCVAYMKDSLKVLKGVDRDKIHWRAKPEICGGVDFDTLDKMYTAYFRFSIEVSDGGIPVGEDSYYIMQGLYGDNTEEYW